MNKNRTHYDNLKVSHDAPVEVIKMAYKMLIQKYHPDKNNNSAESYKMTKLIKNSYRILSDPNLRREYDFYLSQEEKKTERERVERERVERERAERERAERERAERERAERERAENNFFNLGGKSILIAFVVLLSVSIISLFFNEDENVGSLNIQSDAKDANIASNYLAKQIKKDDANYKYLNNIGVDSNSLKLINNKLNSENNNYGNFSLCIELLGGGIFNSILEEACNFKGDLSGKTKILYGNLDCQSLIADSIVLDLSRKVLEDAKKDYQKLGKENFCEVNRVVYDGLLKQLELNGFY